MIHALCARSLLLNPPGSRKPHGFVQSFHPPYLPPHADLPGLHTLRLSGNVFKHSRQSDLFPGVPGPICSTLQRLELRNCFMRGLPPTLSHLTALTALDLSGNRFLELERSDVEIFSRNLTGLRELVSWRAGWRQCVAAASSIGHYAQQLVRLHRHSDCALNGVHTSRRRASLQLAGAVHAPPQHRLSLPLSPPIPTRSAWPSLPA